MAENTVNWGKIYEASYWGIGVSTNTISWGSIYEDEAGFVELVDRFEDRVVTDSGIVESLSCVASADFMDNDWDYYFRVTDDGGLVESLECITLVY